MPISDQLMLAATTPPDYMSEKIKQATLRSSILQNQHAAIVNPQIEAENRQKLETGGQAVQQGALSLLTAQQDQEDAKNLRGYLQAATKPPAAPAPNAGQVAGPQTAVLPGVIGITAAPAPAAAQPQSWDEVADQFQGSGAQPRNVFAFRKLILENKEKAATLAKTLADSSKTQAEVDEKIRDFEAGLANGVKDSGYNQVAMEAALHAADLYSPSSKAHVADIRRQMAAGVPIQSIIDPMVSAATAAQTTALARKASEQTAADKQKREAGGQVAESTAKQVALAGQLLGPATTPDEWAAGLAKLPQEVRDEYPVKFSPQAADLARRRGMNAEQQTAADQAAANAAETAKRDAANIENQRQERKQEGQRIGISAGELGIRQKTFDATFGSGLDANGRALPPDERKAAAMRDPTAVAMANYQIPPPSGRTSALAKATYGKILDINPTYDATLFPARNKTALDYSPAGKAGQAITSTDTGLSHLALISQAGEALKNSDYKALNYLAQSVGAQVGNDPKNTYDTIVQLVAPEVSKAVIGGVGGEAERQALAARFNSTAADNVRENAIRATAQLLGARYEKNRHAYEEQMGKPLERKLSAESQQVLQKYSGGAAQASPNQGAAAPQFKVGDQVMYQGKPHTVTAIKNGKLVLE